MADQEAFERGYKLRSSVFGEDGENRRQELAKFDQDFADYIIEGPWGRILARPGLDTKRRELLSLAAVTALGRLPEVRIHVNGALAVGNSKQEVIESLVQMSIYAGMPAALEAIHVAIEVFKERGLWSSG